MTEPNRRVKNLARKQLDQRLNGIRDVASLLNPPSKGWVRSIRTALGMTQKQLARRAGVSRQAIGQLEGREPEGSVTLKALDRAAQAMGGRLLYAIVPDDDIGRTLEKRARDRALQITGAVRHTMRLEDQEPGSDLDQRVAELTEELLASPARLWSDPRDR